MANKMTIKKGDLVEVLSGKSKGARGHVLRAIPKEMKVVVEGVAVAKKAVRPSQQNPQGGFEQKEMPVPVSTVMLVCPACDKATRVGHATNDEGKKVRVCKKCGNQF